MDGEGNIIPLLAATGGQEDLILLKGYAAPDDQERTGGFEADLDLLAGKFEGTFLESISAEQEQARVNEITELLQAYFNEIKQDLDFQRAELAPNSTLKNVGLGLKNFAVGIWDTVETGANLYFSYQKERMGLINDFSGGVLKGGDFSALEARTQGYIATGEKGIDLAQKTAEFVSLVMGNEELRGVVTQNEFCILGSDLEKQLIF